MEYVEIRKQNTSSVQNIVHAHITKIPIDFPQSFNSGFVGGESKVVHVTFILDFNMIKRAGSHSTHTSLIVIICGEAQRPPASLGCCLCRKGCV